MSKDAFNELLKASLVKFRIMIKKLTPSEKRDLLKKLEKRVKFLRNIQ